MPPFEILLLSCVVSVVSSFVCLLLCWFVGSHLVSFEFDVRGVNGST